MPRATIGSLVTQPAADFDLGPLIWVRPEIDRALACGLESLAALCTQEKDAAALKDARMHLHQAAGAIRMLGLEALAEFTDEIQRNLDHVEGLARPELEAARTVIERSCRKLSILLREIAGGAPPVAMKLYPEYCAMHRSRGVHAFGPSDLFYPDLRVHPPKVALREAIPAEKLPAHLAKKRRSYQGGLLSWLHGDKAGAKAMREAVAGIEGVSAKDSLRSFWWTVRALLEAMTEGGLQNGPDLKQLAGRIDLQIRRVVEGSTEVADRLRREVLYYVAISSPVGPTLRAVQRSFRLSSLVPTADAVNVDVIRMEPLAHEARDQLAGCKETWLKFASGRAENLAKLKQTLALVQARASEIGQAALAKLTAGLAERLDRMSAGAIPDPLAMEFTTALLLAEDAFEDLANLSPELPQQVEAMLARLDAVAAGRPVPGDATIFGELGKRARERMLLAQVGQEIRANLRRTEDVLDSFFRDAGKRSELTSLAKDLSQIRGALRILGLDRAERLLQLCDERIQSYAGAETEVPNDELELLAESLCGLGFYFEEIERERPNSERILAPLLARWLGEPAQPLVEETESVESAVAALRAELPRLVEAAHRDRSDAKAQEEIVNALARLKKDAELIGDEVLAGQADAAIAKLEQGDDSLSSAIEAIAETSAAVPPISEETQRLLGAGSTALEAGLLEIYLAEAAKVLTGITEGHGALGCNIGDREALRRVCRGFHTLKESGRSVGLTELAELASEVEKILSRLIEEERPATSAVVTLIETAHASFGAWFDSLRRKDHLAPDLAKLDAALLIAEVELGPSREQPTPQSHRAPGRSGERSSAPEAPAIAPSGVATKDTQRVALVYSASIETLASVHDEIDGELLARFLDDAAALYRKAAERLQAWRSAPQDQAVAEELCRTLHELKGGARMAGAMRLGQLAQVMESRLLAGKGKAGTAELFEALETDLDLIAYMLAKLRAGESNVALPRLAPKSSESLARAAPAPPSRPPKAPGAEQAIVVPLVTPAAPVVQARPVAASIARPTGNGKMPALKSKLLESANNVGALRDRAREIEARTEVQLRSRMTELHDRYGEGDSNELEGLTGIQDLVYSLSEALKELAAIQQSLMRSLDEAELALVGERASDIAARH
jgi:chemosensory pili system protein ChpA (sensor histidine kinase/response regulator)